MQICFRFGLLELLNEWVNVLNSPLHIGHARGGNCYAARTEDLECGFGIFAFVGDTGMKLGLIAEKNKQNCYWILQEMEWFFVASYLVTDKNKVTERDVDNDIPH